MNFSVPQVVLVFYKMSWNEISYNFCSAVLYFEEMLQVLVCQTCGSFWVIALFSLKPGYEKGASTPKSLDWCCLVAIHVDNNVSRPSGCVVEGCSCVNSQSPHWEVQQGREWWTYVLCLILLMIRESRFLAARNLLRVNILLLATYCQECANQWLKPYVHWLQNFLVVAECSRVQATGSQASGMSLCR